MADDKEKKNMWSFAELKRLALRAWADWNEDQAPRLGAALAYYTTLSLAPLLMLLLAVAGLVFGREAAQGQLFGELRSMLGTEGAKAVEEMVQNASKPASGIVASIIGLATLIFGASSVAGELRESLNTIWNKPYDPNSGIKTMVKERSYALVVVLGCGFLLLVSLAVSSFLAGAGKFMAGYLPLPAVVLQLLNILLSLGVITVVFAALFKYLPDVEVKWKDVMLGAFVTAVLFTIGKFAIGMYLGTASFGSTYGAAGSLVILLVWVYYSAQILFLGAEFTQVYACEHGTDPLCSRQQRPKPEQAVALPSTKVQPKSEHASPHSAMSNFAKQAAAGDAMMLPIVPGPATKPVSMAGTILGGALAVFKIWKIVKK